MDVVVQSDDKQAGQKDKPAAAATDTALQPASDAAAAVASTPGPAGTGTATPKPAGTLSRQGSARAGGTPRGKDTPRTSGKAASVKTAAKGSKKVVPASFVEVIDCLVDVCLQYKGVQPGEESDLADPVTDAEPFFEVSAKRLATGVHQLYMCVRYTLHSQHARKSPLHIHLTAAIAVALSTLQSGRTCLAVLCLAGS